MNCPYDVYFNELVDDGFKPEHAHILAWEMWMHDLKEIFKGE